jgi:hypothetical protein
MSQHMSAEQIQDAYPDEWIVAIDVPVPEGLPVREGVVVFHSPNRSAAIDVFGRTRKPAALWYVAPPVPRDSPMSFFRRDR